MKSLQMKIEHEKGKFGKNGGEVDVALGCFERISLGFIPLCLSVW
jgi:hypothetical protein